MIISGYKDRTLVTKEEVAEILSVSVRKVEFMTEDGTLTAVKLGYRTIRFRLDEVKTLIKKNTAIPAHSR